MCKISASLIYLKCLQMSSLSSLLRPVIATVFSNFFQILQHLGNIFALGIIRIRIPDIGLPHPSTLACLRSARHAKISLFHRDKISIDCFGDKIVAGTIRYVSRCSRWEISTLDASAFAACLFFLFKRSIWTNVQSHCSSARSP